MGGKPEEATQCEAAAPAGLTRFSQFSYTSKIVTTFFKVYSNLSTCVTLLKLSLQRLLTARWPLSPDLGRWARPRSPDSEPRIVLDEIHKYARSVAGSMSIKREEFRRWAGLR
jgi:hypothetical protein